MSSWRALTRVSREPKRLAAKLLTSKPWFCKPRTLRFCFSAATQNFLFLLSPKEPNSPTELQSRCPMRDTEMLNLSMVALREIVRTAGKVRGADLTETSPCRLTAGCAPGNWRWRKMEDGSRHGQALHGTRDRAERPFGRFVAGARRSWRTVSIQSRAIRHAWRRLRGQTDRARVFHRVVTV